ncbi:MAG TPA: cupin domain-containing protein [Candidatus Latescibacteria bacterium]|nr:cupin domain-containing protein [Candidatus Latescibacterota bacterium]
MPKGYFVRRLSEIKGVPCPCGTSYRPITREDTPVLNLHVTEITDSQRHYHKGCTEIYYILEGSGVLEVGDDRVDLTPGTVILIEPGTAHRGYGDFKALIVGVPAMKADDEHII